MEAIRPNSFYSRITAMIRSFPYRGRLYRVCCPEKPGSRE